MVKRRATVNDSDDEGGLQDSSPTSKRARLDDVEEEEVEDHKQNAEENDDDKVFEARYEDKVRASIQSQVKHQGVCISLYSMLHLC